jgi:O-antigen/teichoic acid export membrane protein
VQELFLDSTVAQLSETEQPQDFARVTPAILEDPTSSLSLNEATVRWNIASTLAGNLVFSGSQWLITIVIARMGNMAMVGQYALGLAICLPIFSFTGLSMRAVQATDCTGAYRFKDYLTVRLASTAFALAAVSAVALLMPWRRETVLVVLAVACSRAVDSLSDMQYGLFQLHDRLDLIAWAMCIRAVVGLAALALGMALFHSVPVAMAALTLMWLATALIFEWPITLRMEGVQRVAPLQSTAVATYRRLVILCLPLAFVLLLLSAGANLPRLMLERHAGEQSLGVFSAVAVMSGAMGLLYSALGQTALPRLARLFTSDLDQFHAAMWRMMLFSAAAGVAMLVGAWFFGVRLATMVYGHQSAVTAELVTGLVAVGILNNTSSLLGAGLTASRRFWSQFVASIMFLLITAAVGAWLIPAWGARGAMYAGLAGACFQMAAYGYLGRRRS